MEFLKTMSSYWETFIIFATILGVVSSLIAIYDFYKKTKESTGSTFTNTGTITDSTIDNSTKIEKKYIQNVFQVVNNRSLEISDNNKVKIQKQSTNDNDNDNDNGWIFMLIIGIFALVIMVSLATMFNTVIKSNFIISIIVAPLAIHGIIHFFYFLKNMFFKKRLTILYDYKSGFLSSFFGFIFLIVSQFISLLFPIFSSTYTTSEARLMSVNALKDLTSSEAFTHNFGVAFDIIKEQINSGANSFDIALYFIPSILFLIALTLFLFSALSYKEYRKI